MTFREFAGTLTETDMAIIKDTKGSIFTIGWVNSMGGQCDCCSVDKDQPIEILKVIKVNEVLNESR